MERQIPSGSGHKQRSCRILLLVSFVVAGAVEPSSAIIIRMSLKVLAQKADLIVVGKVVKTGVSQTADGPTRLAFISVTDLLKGTAGDTVAISQSGGPVGRVEMVRSDYVPFETGEQVVVFLWTHPGGAHHILGSSQGKIQVVSTQNGGKNVNLPPEPGKKSVVRMALTEFVQQIRAILSEETKH